MFQEIKKKSFLDSENIILLNNNFDRWKVETINIKKLLKKVMKKIRQPQIIKICFYELSGKSVRTIKNINKMEKLLKNT